MDWFRSVFLSRADGRLSVAIARDTVEAFGTDAERHLRLLQSERPSPLWYRALMCRALGEVRRLRRAPGRLAA